MARQQIKKRCEWTQDDPLMNQYHDQEWGVPLNDDRKLFEFLVLDAFQAGLSWRTVLHKRENFRQAFDNFDPQKIARYSPAKVAKLLGNPGIIRNRAKIAGTIKNAQAFLKLQEKTPSFSDFIWQSVNQKPKINRWQNLKQIPAKTKESNQLSKLLRSHGFTFVGSTICHAFMQAAGLVNDHLTKCPRRQEIIDLV